MHKVYAAFVQNHIEPIIENTKWILEKLDSKGIPITKESLGELLEKAFLASLFTIVMKGIFQLMTVGIIAWTVWMISR